MIARLVRVLWRERVFIMVSLVLWLGLFQLVLGPTLRAQLYKYAPVSYDWRPLDVVVAGDDLIITGTVRKRWGCAYVPPPRAFNAFTRAALEVTTAARGHQQSWPADGLERPFGPWTVRGGGRVVTTFYTQHRCEGLDVFSILGTVDPAAYGGSR